MTLKKHFLEAQNIFKGAYSSIKNYLSENIPVVGASIGMVGALGLFGYQYKKTEKLKERYEELLLGREGGASSEVMCLNDKNDERLEFVKRITNALKEGKFGPAEKNFKSVGVLVTEMMLLTNESFDEIKNDLNAELKKIEQIKGKITKEHGKQNFNLLNNIIKMAFEQEYNVNFLSESNNKENRRANYDVEANVGNFYRNKLRNKKDSHGCSIL